MLSRVASHLYWLSRYLERAENMARILDVGQSIQICISQICCLIREFLEAVSRATQTHGVQGTRSTRLE